MRTKTAPGLDIVERLSELSVELFWMKMRAEVTAEAIDEYHESLPGGE